MERKGLGKRINEVRKDRGFTADKLSRVCHFLKHIETKISLFCKVFLAFFTLLLYNIFVGTTVFAGRISCLLKPFRIMGKNI